jgi:hypothetical protein
VRPPGRGGRIIVRRRSIETSDGTSVAELNSWRLENR